MTAYLDGLLASLQHGAAAASFDAAEFVSEGLESLSLEQLREFLSARLDGTRGEVRTARLEPRVGSTNIRSPTAHWPSPALPPPPHSLCPPSTGTTSSSCR